MVRKYSQKVRLDVSRSGLGLTTALYTREDHHLEASLQCDRRFYRYYKSEKGKRLILTLSTWHTNTSVGLLNRVWTMHCSSQQRTCDLSTGRMNSDELQADYRGEHNIEDKMTFASNLGCLPRLSGH